MTRRARLPNPPALFIGREREVSWTVEAVERGPVVLITAPQGLGKTALVRKVLHDHFPRYLAKIHVVDAGQHQTALEVRMEVLRVAAAMSPRAAVDLRALQAEPERATLAALEIAEGRGAWIVVDGLDAEDTDESQELLTLLASFARKSRWIVTGRPALRVPLLAGQTLRLDAMDRETLRRLALSWVPDLGPRELAASLAAASGSPFQLSRALASGGSGTDLDWLTRGVGPRGVDFLRVVALIEAPLPLELLLRIASDPGEAARDELERRGLLLRGALGYAVHGVVRGALREGGTRRVEELRRAASALAEAHLPAATLEAARLWVEVGDVDRLLALLDEAAPELFALGYAPNLFRLLRGLTDGRFHTLRLRCAAELGNPTALSEVQDAFGDAEDQLAWAETLAARGAHAQSLARALPLLDAKDPSLSQRAALLAAGVQRRLGLHGEAQLTLARLGPSSERDASVLACRVRSGQLDGARQELVRLAQKLLRSEGDLSDAVVVDLAETAVVLGDRGLAERCLSFIARSPRGAEEALLTTRRAQLLQARLELDACDIEAAQERVVRLRRFARGPSALRPLLEVLELGCRLARGELEGWERRAEALSTEGDADCGAELQALRAGAAAVIGRPPPREADDSVALPGLAGARARAFRALHRARHGLAPPTPPARLTAELAVLGGLCEGSRLIVAGRPGEAAEVISAAEQEARRHDLSLLLLEAMALRCDAAIGLGERSAWLQAVEAVIGEPKLARSARLAGDVELHRALVGERCPQASLELLAPRLHIAPVAARRARALLGGDAPLDGVDRRVVEAATAQGYGCPRSVIESPSGTWEVGWGLDERTTTVWLPGRCVDLSSKRLLWQLLLALAELGGGLDKERLICTVWGVAVYHPLQHDSRLHTAIRKLRAEVEDEPRSPARVLTTEEGYRLAGPLRIIRRC